jgi:plasminogen activator inhibitor 1 RNA-binding protein
VVLTDISDHEKQVGHGWGRDTGNGEWADEQAGEAIAKTEITEELGADETAEPAEPVEEEPKTKTLDDYLAEQAEKRLQVSAGTSIRKANEGANKKLPTGQEYTREEEEDFIAASGGKKIRDRGKKEKNILELDGEAMRQTDRQASERRGGRGGRGGPRGDFEGGRGRGSRGRGGDGGRGRGGEFRGRGEGSRGRGGPRGGAGNAPNVLDQSAFPTLGS